MTDAAPGPSSWNILHAASAFIERNVIDEPLRATILDILRGFARESPGAEPYVPGIARIPALVHAAATGDAAPATPLCGIAFLLYLGIDILDDIMDGDTTPYWQGRSPAETLLLGATLTSAVPQLAISRLAAPPDVRAAMQETLAAGLLEMAAGQRADILANRCATIDPRAVEASVLAKSGGMTAMLAALGATLAGATPESCRDYAAWGRAFGAADQLRADCAVLFRDVPCPDLLHGAMTYPVACLLEATEPACRPALFDLLRAAAADREARLAVRRLLQERGALAMSAATIEWHTARAKSALARASPRPGAAAPLHALVDQARFESSFPRSHQPCSTGTGMTNATTAR